jgi:hypothetical protein
MATGKPWQVIAWVDVVKVPVNPHLVRVDLGERHTFVDTPRPVAVVWERADNDAGARAYAKTILDDHLAVEVYTLPASESDPLGVAKARILASQAVRAP